MKLHVTLSGKILSSITIDPQKNDEYYLKAFRRLLLLRHGKKLALETQPPIFSVEEGEGLKKSISRR